MTLPFPEKINTLHFFYNKISLTVTVLLQLIGGEVTE